MRSSPGFKHVPCLPYTVHSDLVGVVRNPTISGGGVSWQRFIARLVAHGPVSEFVPGSSLQTAPTYYTILGNVADDMEIHMA